MKSQMKDFIHKACEDAHLAPGAIAFVFERLNKACSSESARHEVEAELYSVKELRRVDPGRSVVLLGLAGLGEEAAGVEDPWTFDGDSDEGGDQHDRDELVAHMNALEAAGDKAGVAHFRAVLEEADLEAAQAKRAAAELKRQARDAEQRQGDDEPQAGAQE